MNVATTCANTLTRDGEETLKSCFMSWKKQEIERKRMCVYETEQKEQKGPLLCAQHIRGGAAEHWTDRGGLTTHTHTHTHTHTFLVQTCLS